MKRIMALSASMLMLGSPALAGHATPPAYVPDLEPPNPVAGECYARVEIPAQYETVDHRVVTRDAHQRLMVQQPRLETVTERILVKEPSVRFEVRQPTYGTINQQILTRPGFDKLTVSDPSFQTVTETLQHGQPRLVWKRGNPTALRAQGYVIHSTADGGVGGRGYTSTTHYAQTGGQRCGSACEIWCLVEEPGESVTINRQKMVHAGQVQRTPVPPLYKTVTKQVVTDPGGVREVPVPGEYANIAVQKLVGTGGVAKIDVPAEYGHAQGRRLVSESRYEWRRIVCRPGAARPTHPLTHPPRVSYNQGAITGGHGLAGAGATYRSSHVTTTHSSGTTVLPHTSAMPPMSTAYPDPAYSGPAYGAPVRSK